MKCFFGFHKYTTQVVARPGLELHYNKCSRCSRIGRGVLFWGSEKYSIVITPDLVEHLLAKMFDQDWYLDPLQNRLVDLVDPLQNRLVRRYCLSQAAVQKYLEAQRANGL